MEPVPAQPRLTPSAGVEHRVSTLLADRPCDRCMFNLVGQPIMREPHYGLLVVRCPECGSVASLQEYPLLGRWANRWAALAAAAWLLAATALSFGMAGIMFGFTMGTFETATSPLQAFIAKKYEAHQLAQGTPAGQAAGWWNIDPAWWESVDQAALLKEAGGWGQAIQWWSLLIWVIGFSILVPLAAVWATAAVHRRGWRLLLTFAPMLVIAAAFFLLTTMQGSRWLMASDLARDMAWPILMPVCVICSIIPLVIGAFVGRHLARWLVVLLLPPRLRVPLSFLWICDGKPPPRPTW